MVSTAIRSPMCCLLLTFAEVDWLVVWFALVCANALFGSLCSFISCWSSLLHEPQLVPHLSLSPKPSTLLQPLLISCVMGLMPTLKQLQIKRPWLNSSSGVARNSAAFCSMLTLSAVINALIHWLLLSTGWTSLNAANCKVSPCNAYRFCSDSPW